MYLLKPSSFHSPGLKLGDINVTYIELQSMNPHNYLKKYRIINRGFILRNDLANA